MQVTATEAKNRFGYFCSQAKERPGHCREGRPAGYGASGLRGISGSEGRGPEKNLAQRKKEFNEKYREWIAEQNRIVEEFGVFGEEYRLW